MTFTADRKSVTNNAVNLTSGYLKLPTGVYFNSSFSISMWAYLPAAVPSEMGFFDCGNSPFPTDDVYFGIDPSATIFLNTRVGTTSIVVVSASLSVPLLSWSHIATTWNGNSASLYINGNSVGNQVGTTGVPSSVQRTTCYIGKGNNGVVNMVASVDDIRVYSRFHFV